MKGFLAALFVASTFTLSVVAFALDVSCASGDPLRAATGNLWYCGRGGQRCPSGFHCKIDPADRFAICCQDGSSTSHVGCPHGNPLVGSDGVQLFCGLGPTSTTCPVGSYCLSSPVDAYAFCCAKSH